MIFKVKSKEAIPVALSVQKDGDVTVASFDNDRILDELLIQKLGDELIGLTQGTDVQKLLLDFRNVEFMSSAMIGKLVLVNKKCGAANKPLRFCCINSNLMEVFRLTNLDKVFKIDPDVAASFAKF
jgi:anti-sigma B factor antagonist